MPVQLPLNIGLRDSATFTNFYAGDNAQLVEQCRACAVGEGEQFVYLHGVAGTGKSHLLQAICHEAAARGRHVAYLPMHEICNMPPAALEGMEVQDILCIDDIDVIAGDSAWETALFHLYNRVRDAGNALVVAADRHASELGIGLPDLQSRLAWGLLFRLQALDDTQLGKALQMRARARGMDMSDEVAAYILKRCPRDMNTLFDLLETLDRESLAAKRRLTIPFVKNFL